MENNLRSKYDDPVFFEKYSQMSRSQQGLEGAGEWETLQKLLPDFQGKRVLDLGCGYGWHCIYAMEHGAAAVTGVDLSERMLAVAQEKTRFSEVRYLRMPIEETDFPPDSFDIVFSSLAFHYVRSFEEIVRRVSACLTEGGHFIFSVEHPVFTAYGTQDWIYDEEGEILHFPVDRYFLEGKREARFLGEEVVKYHKTLTTYLSGLLHGGFELLDVVEPQPPEPMLSLPGMQDEMRRPLFLIVSARKKPVLKK
ncbi:MAG: class I SAM-dependent methyltransferase [Provencibacterium sp.]|jgi:SAM-dependent methyltransferase|nr:class I SAM-dependent methyltransferase [Provencibacterium sp.]